jgi:hypothetical protein
MRKLVRSTGYQRFRALLGAGFIVLGAVLLYRTVAITGIGTKSIPSFVLGAAMIALGVLRLRDFLALTASGRK